MQHLKPTLFNIYQGLWYLCFLTTSLMLFQCCGPSAQIDPLTDNRLERAWYYRGNLSKVDIFLRKLRSPQGSNITVVVLGGSMTKGENTAVAWPFYFSRSLRRQYPRAPPIRVHNLAMGGSSSAKCLQMQLQTLRAADKEHGIDLIVVEYALNGKTSFTYLLKIMH
jgi:hypothetical protein